ncbi:hypothetical protein TEA_009032 [Camellia sinensis var. sinensis]|uniref:Uncharacterized protein n=1 Tax=Camellia sinensis var. sinensis TaxID=542762 RepID=A0A4S4EMU8_CAMSN|nr:hypothetical protein TEA_009032 [Camellia sinensis var. sinensis]
MATSSHHRLLLQLSILLGLLALSATARPGRHFHPCKTLIFFSASSSSSSSDSLDQNPNFSPQNPSITVFFTEIREIHPKPTTFVSSYPTVIVDRATVDDVEEHDDNRPLPFGLYSSSFRDRTKDILSVVGSLLFGVGCGALTAATLYLICSSCGQGGGLRKKGDSDAEDLSYPVKRIVMVESGEKLVYSVVQGTIVIGEIFPGNAFLWKTEPLVQGKYFGNVFSQLLYNLGALVELACALILFIIRKSS